jgi:hypothetical protein
MFPASGVKGDDPRRQTDGIPPFRDGHHRKPNRLPLTPHSRGTPDGLEPGGIHDRHKPAHYC